MIKKTALIQFYLRIAMGVTFLVPGLDRLGVWGPHGKPNVSWGDWAHFSAYAKQLMGFLPGSVAGVLAVLATVGEIGFGALLILGLFTRMAAVGAGLLLLCFALSMWITYGIVAPLSYSVFVDSAACLLLSTISAYKWSLDAVLFTREK